MKINTLILTFLVTILLTSCPGVYDVPNYTSIIDVLGGVLIPEETVIAFPVYTNEDADEWKHSVYFTINVLRGYTTNGIYCSYGGDAKSEEIRDVSYHRTEYRVPINVAFSRTGLSYFCRWKIIFPAEVTLSKSEAHIGDEISVTCAKPVFDVDTFSLDKLKRLEEINYCPIWLKCRGTANAWIDISISDCTIDSPYHIKFTVPENAVSNQVLVLNEGGFENRVDPNVAGEEELCETYINFNSTSCEKYAYYASKTELLILDASGDRVD